MNTPSFKEDHISQIPALQMLVNMGYTYLSQEESLQARGNKTSNVKYQMFGTEIITTISYVQYLIIIVLQNILLKIRGNGKRINFIN
jgi:hypothetical protein